ncbi:hypothetical protein [Flavobacterium sp. B17]|uniref:hypothetical protein n=1 Tax=Flavobacterium sp. B17 TaxID=95618 RepID=UPI00034A0A25|nr:hypothetical protein [Flavobacterium sp. B17]
MLQIRPFSDNRLRGRCVYCGGSAETRDHVPSKCLLDKPYPENLPVVECCDICNQGFSSDEQYFACFIECVKSGSTNIVDIERDLIRDMLEKSPSLRKRIENNTEKKDGNIIFYPEDERIKNVLLKLVKGHTAYELSLSRFDDPQFLWFGLLSSLPDGNKIDFNSVHFQQNVGEIGSRSMQQLLVTTLINHNGENINVIINDWVDVQENKYRYIAIDDMGKIIVRIVFDELWGCEVVWEK